MENQNSFPRNYFLYLTKLAKNASMAAVIALCITTSFSSNAQVIDTYMRWWSNSAYFTDNMTDICLWYVITGACGSSIDPTTEIQNSGNHYLNFTDFVAGQGPNGEGRIDWSNGNYGNIGWLGVVLLMRNDTEYCNDPFTFTTTGNCDTGNYRANNAYIMLNEHYFRLGTLSENISFWYDAAPVVMRHELGHVVGMHHTPVFSFMRPYVQNSHPHFLQPWEILWINQEY